MHLVCAHVGEGHHRVFEHFEKEVRPTRLTHSLLKKSVHSMNTSVSILAYALDQPAEMNRSEALVIKRPRIKESKRGGPLANKVIEDRHLKFGKGRRSTFEPSIGAWQFFGHHWKISGAPES